MSAPTPAPGDDSPREGYYPDPSIPGYVRYWNGASWVPGTSRPAPPHGAGRAGGPATGADPAPTRRRRGRASATRTGSADAGRQPRPQHGRGPSAASVWQADPARQTGFGGERDRRVSWGGPAPEPAAAPADPRTPLAAGPDRAARCRGCGTAAGRRRRRGRARRRRARSRSARRARRPVPHSRRRRRAPRAPTPSAERRYAAGAAGTPGAPRPPRRPGRAPRTGPGARARPAGAAAGSGPGPGRPRAASVPRRPACSPGPRRRLGVLGAAGPPTGPARQQQRSSTPPAAAAQHHQAQPAPRPPQQQPHPHAAASSGSPPARSRSTGRDGARAADQPVVPWKPPAADDPFQQLVRGPGGGPARRARQAVRRPAGRHPGARRGRRRGRPSRWAPRRWTTSTEKIDAAKQTGETVTVWLLDATTAALPRGPARGLPPPRLPLRGAAHRQVGPHARQEALRARRAGHRVPRPAHASARPCAAGSSTACSGSWSSAWSTSVVPVDRPWRQCWHDKAARTFVAG